MARIRKKQLTYGDRFNIYISELVDPELLDFINKQSDLTATVMAGLIKLYQDNGNENLINQLPRSYSVNAYMTNSVKNAPPTMGTSSEKKAKETKLPPQPPISPAMSDNEDQKKPEQSGTNKSNEASADVQGLKNIDVNSMLQFATKNRNK